VEDVESIKKERGIGLQKQKEREIDQKKVRGTFLVILSTSSM
jgi:hypothetical protein